MVDRLKHRWWLWLLGGLVVGVLIGGFCPHSPLHATATDRFDTFAIATGPVDSGIEAVYFLDFLTGNLKAAVLGNQTGKFSSLYQRNIIADLGVDPAKKPRYLLVTGLADLRRTAGMRMRPSAATVYVAEITSGNVAAYVIPWNPHGHSAGQVFKGQIYLLDVLRFRDVRVRPSQE